ncbi:MAG: tetratricopeptide repeat protein [Cyclobacteriaceae bacterium]|nr:tetratricopeptide repeat protein [Cyclobacteriaceae bacterium]
MKNIRLLFLLATIPAWGQSSLEQAKKLYEKRSYSEAKPLLESIKDTQPEYAAAQYYLGRVAFDEKKFEDAADYFEEATESRNGQVAEYFGWLGDAYGSIAQDANPLRQGFLAPKMKSAWEKAIALDAKYLPARFSLISFYTQAPAIMGGSMDKAKEMARQITEISPAQGHRSMGNLFVREKNVPAAEKEYLEMVRLEPGLTPVLGNFYVNEKMFDKAFAVFDGLVKRNPLDMLAHYQLGKTSAISGQRLNEGEQSLLKYLEYTPKQNEPSHAGANMRLAQILEKKGKKDEARLKYEAALKMDNNLKEAKEGLSRVSKL